MAMMKKKQARCVVAAALCAAALGVWGFAAQERAHAQEQEPAPTARAYIGGVDWGRAEQDAEAAGLESSRALESTMIDDVTAGRADADDLLLPLLFPSSLIEAERLGQLDEPLLVNADRFAYSAEARAAPRSYLVQGSRFIFVVDEIDYEAPAPTAEDIFVEQLIDGVEASFERYGVLYSVAIFCADPIGDPQCVSDETVRRLAAEMALMP